MRISDWSSDVCSSDLTVLNFRRLRDEGRLTLYPQPIMGIRGPEPRLAKAEFLMRMRMRDGYQSLPPDTVETLEYFGLTPELDAFSARSEEHTSELQSLMRISYAVFCLKTKITEKTINTQD